MDQVFEEVDCNLLAGWQVLLGVDREEMVDFGLGRELGPEGRSRDLDRLRGVGIVSFHVGLMLDLYKNYSDSE